MFHFTQCLVELPKEGREHEVGKLLAELLMENGYEAPKHSRTLL